VERTRKRGSFFWVAGLLTLGLATFMLFGLNSGARAETGMKALILGSTVSGGATSAEAQSAIGNGFAVTVVDDATWGAMTTAQFSDYQLIIIGDPTCSSLPRVVSENAQALADAVMDRGATSTNTRVGNRVLIGTDPRFHFGQGGTVLIDKGIDFAGALENASGLFMTFTCFDPDYDLDGTPDGQEKLLPLLTADPAAAWTQNQSPPCGGAVSLISNAAQFSGMTTANLQGWGCSVHETFPTYPADWAPLAVATDTTTKPTCGNDVDTGEAKCGQAYILVSGVGITATAPNLELDPATDSNPVGTPHTVTATVTNPDDTPRSGVLVSWVVTGVNAGATGTCAPASCTTGADGKVAYTYTGTAAGDDTINAAITVDGSRQTATAAKTWVEAPRTGSVEGKGSFQTGKEFGRVTFEVDANASGGTFHGITGNGFTFTATSVTGFSQSGNTASFSGGATIKGPKTPEASTYTYAVRFVDNGTPGREDTVEIVVRDAAGAIVFATEGPALLKTGNVVVDDGVVD
jgi:Bacterial Ig-like domain (group 1)